MYLCMPTYLCVYVCVLPVCVCVYVSICLFVCLQKLCMPRYHCVYVCVREYVYVREYVCICVPTEVVYAQVPLCVGVCT